MKQTGLGGSHSPRRYPIWISHSIDWISMINYSDDPSVENRLSTSFNVKTEKVANWRDFLRVHCYTIEDHVKQWPSNPPSFSVEIRVSNRDRIFGHFVFTSNAAITGATAVVAGAIGCYCGRSRRYYGCNGRQRYRDFAGAITVAERYLKPWPRLLEAISESLGLKKDHIDKTLGSHGQHMALNYYQPCPQPPLTNGLPGHTDPNLITILLQDDAPGLQVLRNGERVAVNPIPNTFIVNIGDKMQVSFKRL
ncbi:Caffeic acid 3-O-methyltransferase 1 [Hibiscus syriacus]|uniref:Caffeic acid 3-O-methyltransferase 1 n=1 Tax=Hibiscus syriacus TaxID=106335 RepID=A0A6A2X802_HIBSY|nr:Caffeic acid 3-O-methyltransferase 1 [Hibiscus syriacus]